jgi:nucleotide-binding universal stress UspA family protein
VYSSSIPTTEILYTTDFSETSRRALACAKQIARRRGALLRALHVIDLTGHTGPAHSSFNAAIETARRAMRVTRRQLRLAGIREDVTVISGGSISLAIRDAAVRYRSRMIVMGLHGEAGISTPTFGGNVRRLFRTSPCPILTVGLRGTDNPAPAFERVLCVTDASAETVASVREAWPLDGEDAPLAHFVVLPNEAADESPQAGDVSPALAPQSIVDYHQAAGLILAKAAESRADLIIVGLRGGGCLDTLGAGSVVRTIWSKCACPVLIVRSAGEPEAPMRERFTAARNRKPAA